MLQVVLAVALAIEKLIPLLSKALDLAIAAREDAKRAATEKAIAADQAAKDARNAAAIAAARRQP